MKSTPRMGIAAPEDLAVALCSSVLADGARWSAAGSPDAELLGGACEVDLLAGGKDRGLRRRWPGCSVAWSARAAASVASGSQMAARRRWKSATRCRWAGRAARLVSSWGFRLHVKELRVVADEVDVLPTAVAQQVGGGGRSRWRGIR